MLSYSQCFHYENKVGKLSIYIYSKSFWGLSIGLTNQTINGMDLLLEKKNVSLDQKTGYPRRISYQKYDHYSVANLDEQVFEQFMHKY